MSRKVKILIALFAFAFLGMEVGATTPALASIGAAFPNVPFSTIVLIATLPSLFCIPSSLLAGRLAGSVMKYRTIVILSAGINVIAGVGPFFVHDITSILVFRSIFGLSSGAVYPLVPGLVFAYFSEDQERANFTGAAYMCMSIGGVIFQMLGGLLCTYKWNYTFLVYVIGILSFVLITLFMPEPEKRASADGKQLKINYKLPGKVFLYALMGLILFILEYPFLTGMSSLVMTENLGSPAIAASIVTMFSVGAILLGMTYGLFYKIFKKFMFSFGMAIFALGYVILLVTQNAVAYMISGFFVGYGVMCLINSLNMWAGKAVDKEVSSFAISIVQAIFSLGGFLSGFVVAFITGVFHATAPKFPFQYGLAVIAVALIVYTLAAALSKKTASTSETSKKAS